MTSQPKPSLIVRLRILRAFLLALYLGKKGYRAALIAYAIGFWIFAIGAMLIAFWEIDPPAFIVSMRIVMLHIGLFILVMMTFPVLRCAFDTDDLSRPKSRFRRILEPTVIGLFSPFYVMFLVASFIRYVGPIIFGTA
ncbi:MAG: hypothetical protein HOJ90_00275 [Alphaproteobacteria bacterium]|jgi:hypothetical protein|nr:hypothetical protein [Alphaproteobacteria bacterium]